MLSPTVQSFCVPTHGAPPTQLCVTSQHSPALTPLAHVPNVASLLQAGVDEQLLAMQSQSKPSSVPPTQRPTGITHTPSGAQSPAPLHACPSCGPAEHKNSPVGGGALPAQVPPGEPSALLLSTSSMQANPLRSPPSHTKPVD